MVLYGLLLTAGLALLCLGVVLALNGEDLALVGLGVLAVIVPAALYPVASARRADAGAAVQTQARLLPSRRPVRCSNNCV